MTDDPIWTDEELAEFDRITRDLSSPRQMNRINGRIDIKNFVAEHGETKCDAMFKFLKEQDAKR